MREQLKNQTKIIVKIGTSSLTHSNGKLNLLRINELAWVLSDLQNSGKQIVLVSSGAIAVGTTRLGLKERPRDITLKQVASAVGQGVLMQIYESFFSKYNQKIAQILLTHDVLQNKITRTNAQNTLNELLNLGVIPIVNENDTICTDEIQGFSDNDNLSACVCELINAQSVIILSDIDGMYDSNPYTNKNAKKLSIIHKIDEKIEKMALGTNNTLGTGGMSSKVKSAKIITKIGASMIIASGQNPKIVYEILQGKDIGTIFLPQNQNI